MYQHKWGKYENKVNNVMAKIEELLYTRNIISLEGKYVHICIWFYAFCRYDEPRYSCCWTTSIADEPVSIFFLFHFYYYPIRFFSLYSQSSWALIKFMAVSILYILNCRIFYDRKYLFITFI